MLTGYLALGVAAQINLCRSGMAPVVALAVASALRALINHAAFLGLALFGPRLFDRSLTSRPALIMGVRRHSLFQGRGVASLARWHRC